MSKKKDSLKPWLSRPTINRSVTLPLTRPLTQRLSNLNEFHPNELDPFLLFDARDSMIGTLENPTLDLDPSKPDTLNVITATRAGTATYTDVNGLIASAPANTVRVDQTQGAELTPTKFQNITNTDFSSGWSTSSMTSVTSEGFQGNPSVVLTSTSGNGYNRFQFTTVSNQIYIASFYIRRLTGSGGIKFINWDSATTPNVPDISSQVSSEWSIATVTFLGRSGGGNVSFGVRCVTSGDSVEIAMPQVEEGTTPSSFVANTTGSPKFITGATFGPRVPMILVEPSATNLVANSNFGGWVIQSNTTLTSNTTETLSPDGTNNATKMTSNGSEGLYVASLGTASLNTKSIFLKGVSGGEQVILQDPHQNIDPLTCTLTTEWQRFHLTQTQTGSFGLWLTNIPSSGIYAFGPQNETGSLTSYIPTSGSTVTRAADDLEISGSAFSDFFNATEGTVYAEFLYDHDQTSKYVYSISETGNNEIRSQILSSSLRNRYVVNSSNVANLEKSGILRGSLNRSAFSYKTNNFRLNLNGTTDSEQLSGTASINPVRLSVGNRSLGNHLNGRIRRILYWPYSSDRL